MQTAALRGLLAEVGYADALLARELPDGKLQLIDGHLRAETTPSAMVPVLILGVSEAEADKIVLTLDPLAGMAESDSERLEALLNNVRTDSKAVEQLFARIAEQDALQVLRPPVEILDPEPQLERAAELQVRWGTARWPHLLVCGDSTDPADVAKLWIAGGPLIRLTWTDPPYGIDYVRSKNAALQHLHKGPRVKKSIANDSLTPGQTHALFACALTLARKHSAKAIASLWWLTAHRDGIVATTAPTWLQVEKVIWGEVKSAVLRSQWCGKLKFPVPMQTELRLGPQNYAIGLSTDDSSRFQGFHSGHVLIVLDEAPGVRAEVCEAVEGIRAGGQVRVLALGNPTVGGGPFYDAFTHQSGVMEGHYN